MILTKDNCVTLEDKITYLLSELYNDSSPLGQEAYRHGAKRVIEEVKNFKPVKQKNSVKRKSNMNDEEGMEYARQKGDTNG